MTDFVGKQNVGVDLRKGQKSPFDSRSAMVELDQEWISSLFRFFSCPGHEVTGESLKGLRATKEHCQSPPQNADLGRITTMPLYETYRGRKTPEKTFLPWPGFFYFHEYLSDRLLGLYAGSLCPLQIAGHTPCSGIVAQWAGDRVVESPFPVQVGPQEYDNNQSANRYVR
jgi:hypothetical protein